MTKLETYHMMVISQYFPSIKIFVSIELVCKKYNGNMVKFHNNPISINQKTIKYFSNIETLNIYNKYDETFGNDVFKTTKKTNTADKIKFFKINVWCEKYGQIIPKNVKKLGTRCLTKYKKQSITIPNSVTLLEDNCFSNCTSLQFVKLPSYLQCIENGCFYCAFYLKEINIPDTGTKIGENCFECCYSLSSIKLPKALLCLPNNLCERCTNLQTVTYPTIVDTVGFKCFDGCSMQSVQILNCKYRLCAFAFSNCKLLKSVTITGNLDKIKCYCFLNCELLVSVSLPDCVTLFGDHCFNQCKSLEFIKLPEKLNEIQVGCFGGCINLKKIEIGSKLYAIGSCCFSGCINLEDLILPNGLVLIGENLKQIKDECFGGCTTLEITVPSTLVLIGKNAFSNCKSVIYQKKITSKQECIVI
ncbi:hypothetical protein EIN_216370 [Entamoeba invadens IP1]|uniref:Leucine rich repeat containing protein BspA family protein n=1 Tax=Entamoeba invadens IP1 TaxID=370355 RepID=A0A0A1UCB3_ENTIV|nr:hypothetical protein EIN_216370 [Entamoeba invadens IP1]ELP92892.1 hypothetical protein EIN_216370 [Entamoeba invadens IP1]|eukprot:XP_004259663.1 hypothetical protein EIN_216370 [Entamoeba invadens IP1]